MLRRKMYDVTIKTREIGQMEDAIFDKRCERGASCEGSGKRRSGEEPASREKGRLKNSEYEVLGEGDRPDQTSRRPPPPLEPEPGQSKPRAARVGLGVMPPLKSGSPRCASGELVRLRCRVWLPPALGELSMLVDVPDASEA